MRDDGVTKHQLRFRKQRDRKERAKEKRQRQRQQKKSGTIVSFPQTLETLRNPDETILPKDDPDLQYEEENVSSEILKNIFYLRMNCLQFIITKLSLKSS